MRTPKLSGRSDWYPYYAAYSAAFVEDVLTEIKSSRLPILDPWNGSGTTTVVARKVGRSAIGLDANPALVTIARARLLTRSTARSLEPLAKDIASHAGRTLGKGRTSGTDPLDAWFQSPTTRRIRAVSDSILHLLTTANKDNTRQAQVDGLSDLAALYYVALFSVVRELTKRFRTTNPTWLKSTGAERIEVEWTDLKSSFLKSTLKFQERLALETAGDESVTVSVGNAQATSLAGRSVGAVVSSPPYCTRIDYIVATRPELAVLGFNDQEIRALRDGMLGTPTITSRDPKAPGSDWGATASTFVEAVRAHKSKASETYYARYFEQYFDQLSRSVDEIVRVRTTTAPVVLVVQDSYYKEVRLDLATVVREMLVGRAAFSKVRQQDFESKTLAATHPGARAYRTQFVARESVLMFES